MRETWSPEQEEGFGIRGPDKGALTPDQQRALDDLRVQTARDSQEYLHQHPEVRAMLSLLVREALQQERDVRAVAGELFRSETDVVAAVRCMLGMAPKHVAARKRRSDEVDVSRTRESSLEVEREVTFTEDLPHKRFYTDEGAPSSSSADEAHSSTKRRDTPAPWTQEFELMSQMMDDITSSRRPTEEDPSHMENQDMKLRRPMSIEWLQRELEQMTGLTGEKASPGTGRRPLSVPWVLSGKSSTQLMVSGEDAEEGEEEIPLARRDTPAPWSGPVANSWALGRTEREQYVLGLLEKILEEPADYDSVFEKLHKITEPEN